MTTNLYPAGNDLRRAGRERGMTTEDNSGQEAGLVPVATDPQYGPVPGRVWIENGSIRCEFENGVTLFSVP